MTVRHVYACDKCGHERQSLTEPFYGMPCDVLAKVWPDGHLCGGCQLAWEHYAALFTKKPEPEAKP